MSKALSKEVTEKIAIMINKEFGLAGYVHRIYNLCALSYQLSQETLAKKDEEIQALKSRLHHLPQADDLFSASVSREKNMGDHSITTYDAAYVNGLEIEILRMKEENMHLMKSLSQKGHHSSFIAGTDNINNDFDKLQAGLAEN